MSTILYKRGIQLLILLFIVVCFLFIWFVSAVKDNFQLSRAMAQEFSHDAVAVRVIPNPEHYSARHWYKIQGFTGSPQALVVDGYEAIRDGRTVYVNAANINDNGTANVNDDELYTNIYLISYNQGADHLTTNIFSQILKHWKFNANITTSGQCSQTNSAICLMGSDCPTNEYCLSQKAKIIRDTKRLADLTDIEITLKNYFGKQNHKYYPKLDSGTYYTQKTISVWPSWKKILAQELEMDLPVDPINKLGDCGSIRFHPVTCWDEKIKEFADPTPADFNFNLPADSFAYVYESENNGKSYILCANILESGYSNIGANSCLGAATTNNPPIFIGASLPILRSGNQLIGFIRAIDPDGDVLTWSFSLIGDWSSWINPPDSLLYTPQDNQKKIHGDAAGNPGDYLFSVTVTDDQGATVAKNFTIEVSANNPPIISAIGDQVVRVGMPTTPITINASDPENDLPIVFYFPGPSEGLSITLLDAVSARISGTVNIADIYNIGVSATDSRGAIGNQNYTLRVNSYCGDGVPNIPINMEDIAEECDSNAIACVDSNGYNGVQTCQNDCTWGSCVASESCGDGAVNGLEECDYGNNNICCLDCAWTCPPHDTAVLGFDDGTGGSTTTKNLVNSESTTFIFPACRLFDNSSGLVDIKLKQINIGTAIVYVTDVSGSMDWDLDGNATTTVEATRLYQVKQALLRTMDELHNNTVASGTDINIGLVSFSASASTDNPIVDINVAANRDNLKTAINSYAILSSTNTHSGIEQARILLNGFNAERKIIVLLSDGTPTVGVVPPTSQNNAKADGILIHTIAFTNNVGLQTDMCGWSSDNGIGCYTTGKYAYKGMDADVVYGAITSEILNLPAGVVSFDINSAGYSFTTDMADVATRILSDFSIDLSNINCANNSQALPFSVNFTGGGEIEFSNFRINYCPYCSP